jgi:dihydrofolate reductase
MISIIAAMDEDRIIGRDGALPWHLPADLRRFKQLTVGHAIIMGRKTWESIGRVLPERLMIVVSRQRGFQPDNVHVAGSLDEACRLARAQEKGEVFVIGGTEIYRQALPLADRMYLTRVHAHVGGDAYFPSFDPDRWTLIESERHEATGPHDYAFTWQVFERRVPTQSNPQSAHDEV